MEYEWEENDVGGDVPEFGAIFMSNNATKEECFKWKVFALPYSMANFVKQVKEGMVLFLFEYERRQLFGVYKAISDGAMNIAPHAINSSGKRFPAQVRFMQMWSCKPLPENEFRDAIRENYLSTKKFRFGLSEEQVRRLLHLFSTRKLNVMPAPRQVTRAVTGPGGKYRRQGLNRGLFDRREGLEMEFFEDDFTSADVNGFLEYTPDRVYEADENILFVDDRLENGKNMNTFGLDSCSDQVGDFLHTRKRERDNEAESELYAARTSFLPYRTDNQEVFLDKERMQAARARSLMAENAVNDYNIYTSPPASATKYDDSIFDLSRRADYNRSPLERVNVHGNDDTFLGDDNIGKNQNLHGSYGPMWSNENEEHLERVGGAVGERRVFISSSRPAQEHLISDDIKSVHPSESYLMGRRLASKHDLVNGLQLSEKLRNPFSSDERRYFHGDKVTNANYRETNSYVPSGNGAIDGSMGQGASDALYKTRIGNKHDIEMHLQPVSSRYTVFPQSRHDLLDGISKPCPDTQFSQIEGPQFIRNLKSRFHDSVVTRTTSGAPELPTLQHGYSLRDAFDRGTNLPLENPHYCSEGDWVPLPNGKVFDRKGFGRYDQTSDYGNGNPYSTDHVSHFHNGQCSESMKLIPSAPDDVRDSVPIVASLPLAESFDSYCRRNSPLASDNRSVYLQENDERIADNIVPSSILNLAGANAYDQQRYLATDEVDYYKSNEAEIAIDGSQRCLNPRGGYPDFGKQRRSVFSRLRSPPRISAQEEKRKIADFYMDKSVDELMDVLNSGQNSRNKNPRKSKPVVKQFDRDESPWTQKWSSPERVQPRFATTKVEERPVAIKEGVDELPKETREVEFKRRSDLKKELDENSTKEVEFKRQCESKKDFNENSTSTVQSTQESTSRGIHDSNSREHTETESPVNKEQKRRKLVRPVF